MVMSCRNVWYWNVYDCVLPVYFQQFQNFPWLPDGWVFMGFVYYSLCINPFGEGDISEVCRPSSCCFVCRTDLWSCDCEVERKNPLSQLIRSWVGATQGGSVKNKWFFLPCTMNLIGPIGITVDPSPRGVYMKRYPVPSQRWMATRGLDIDNWEVLRLIGILKLRVAALFS